MKMKIDDLLSKAKFKVSKIDFSISTTYNFVIFPCAIFSTTVETLKGIISSILLASSIEVIPIK